MTIGHPCGFDCAHGTDTCVNTRPCARADGDAQPHTFPTASRPLASTLCTMHWACRWRRPQPFALSTCNRMCYSDETTLPPPTTNSDRKKSPPSFPHARHTIQ
eukprot:7387348-Prymnesium_polylepis.2